MENNMQPEKLLYTVDEVSKILQTNVAYVHKLRKANLLPFLKLGSYKVRKEALKDFLLKYEGYDLTDPEHPTLLGQIKGDNQ